MTRTIMFFLNSVMLSNDCLPFDRLGNCVSFFARRLRALKPFCGKKKSIACGFHSQGQSRRKSYHPGHTRYNQRVMSAQQEIDDAMDDDDVAKWAEQRKKLRAALEAQHLPKVDISSLRRIKF